MRTCGVIFLAAACVLASCTTRHAMDPENHVADTKFSHDRGFYHDPFTVNISTATRGATVVYTTDGSAPSPEHGKVGRRVFIDETTVLRAMAYKNGMAPTNVDTQTYIFPRRVAQQGMKNESRAARRGIDVEVDPDVVRGNETSFVEGLLSLPSLSLATDDEALFGDEGIYFDFGDGARREIGASVELLYPETEKFQGFRGFHAEVGVKLHAPSENIQKRSLRLAFRKKYGQGKLSYPVFESAVHHGGSAVEVFETLVLRAGGQANWSHRLPTISERSVFVRDQHTRDTQIAMSGAGARGVFVHVYLNGIYWGIYNLVERPDRHFLASYLEGGSKDWMAVNHSGVVGEAPAEHLERWEKILRFATETDLSAPEAYREMKALLDTQQFIDYVIVNWFAGTGDWGKNNWYAAVPQADNGGVMFFSWDAELTYGMRATEEESGLFMGSPVAWVHPSFVGNGNAVLHRLWRALAASEEFRAEFRARVDRAIEPGGPLSDRANRERFLALADHVEPAVVCESARWGDTARGRESDPRTLEGDWIPARDRVSNELMVGNASRFLAALQNHDLYPKESPAIVASGNVP